MLGQQGASSKAAKYAKITDLSESEATPFLCIAGLCYIFPARSAFSGDLYPFVGLPGHRPSRCLRDVLHGLTATPRRALQPTP